VEFQAPADRKLEKIELFRSTTDLRDIPLDLVQFPITRTILSGESVNKPYPDAFAGNNVTYYYTAHFYPIGARTGIPSNITTVSIPDKDLPKLTRPSLLVDKVHYILEISEGGEVKKKYPLALGQDPVKRKLHQDRASTPEGHYRIINLQPRATYYRAYDINYPNPVDRIRYEFARESGLIKAGGGRIPSIGGEIQIHGMGIANNWTWGCVAMRNDDIDELFAHKEIKGRTPVTIVGRETGRDDIACLKKYSATVPTKALQQKLAEKGYLKGPVNGQLDKRTRKAIGRLQVKNGLPATCSPDGRTVKILGLE
jgi:hypothetical protein